MAMDCTYDRMGQLLGVHPNTVEGWVSGRYVPLLPNCIRICRLIAIGFGRDFSQVLVEASEAVLETELRRDTA